MEFLIYLFIIILSLSVCGIIIFIYFKKYNNIKNENNEMMKIINNINNETPTMEINERLEYTKNLLDFIDRLIFDELINEKRFDIFSKKYDKNLNFDEVMTEISTNVFNSIKPDIFIEPNVILTEKSLMRYIQKKTFVSYFTYIEKNVSSQL